MITINLRSYIKDADPEDVFYALADREGLKSLMPRLRKVEFVDQSANSETVVMHVGIGGNFGTIRCEGKLSWEEPRELTFEVSKPLPVKTHWTFAPAVNGTEINITMNLQLEPMLGPLAKFVPKNTVEDMMVKELKFAIQQVAQRVKEGVPRNPAVAA